MNGITLLCKVVDNYGDAGVVYRLARALSALPDCPPLGIIIDDARALAQLAPGIVAGQAVQTYECTADSGCAGVTWRIYDWNAGKVCAPLFEHEMPDILLECFQCGRPDWLDGLLFAPGAAFTTSIVNIDYLTAESYAEDFHCLQSLTRSARIRKVNFMPGFTAKTGGLILDAPFMSRVGNRAAAFDALAAYGLHDDGSFIVPVFTYERDFTPLVTALTVLNESAPGGKHIAVYLAPGRSCKPFLTAWCLAGRPFRVMELPFMSQTAWDALLCAADFSFIRGEDSFARACLAGAPFVWHAYVQDEEYQLVKVQALLDRMRPYFASELFETLQELFLLYNRTYADGGAACSTQLARQSELLVSLFAAYDRLRQGYAAFAADLRGNGDLASHLLAYVRECFCGGNKDVQRC